MWQVAPLASVSSRDLDNFLLMWVPTNLVLLFLSFFLLKKILDKKSNVKMGQFSLVQPLSIVRLFVTPWIAAHQASLSITS